MTLNRRPQRMNLLQGLCADYAAPSRSAAFTT